MHGGDIYRNSVDIDFSVNLNPFRTPELERIAEEAYKEGMAASGVYPDPEQTALRSSLAAAEGVIPECVFAGCGASELIMAAVHAISPSRALLVEPCYSGYEHALKSARDCRIERFILNEKNGFILTEDVIKAMTADIDVLFLADPANPTGQNIEEQLLVKILDRADELGIAVILDRSFFMLSDKYLKCTHEYVAKKIERYPHLYIMGSYTKCFAFPGIRMGYVISRPENVQKLRTSLPEWNLPAVSDAYMRRLSDYSTDGRFFTESIKYISRERDFLVSVLSSSGITVFGSNTNFLLLRTQKDIYEMLISSGILIRRCNDFYGLDEQYFRIAVRSHEDNVKLLYKLP